MNFRGGFCGKFAFTNKAYLERKHGPLVTQATGITCNPFYPYYTGFPFLREYGAWMWDLLTKMSTWRILSENIRQLRGVPALLRVSDHKTSWRILTPRVRVGERPRVQRRGGPQPGPGEDAASRASASAPTPENGSHLGKPSCALASPPVQRKSGIPRFSHGRGLVWTAGWSEGAVCQQFRGRGWLW